LILMAVASSLTAQTIDLSGQWHVTLDSLTDSQQINMAKKQYISLPGTTDLAGIGNVCQLKPRMEKPQVLHLTRRHSFIGTAWYSRTIDIPKAMARKPITIELERVMWTSELYIDGKQMGKAESLVAPHTFTITEGLTEGTHAIALKIDNRKQYDISANDLAHAYTNDTQVMWNGVLGKMTLTAHNKISIDNIQIYPDLDAKQTKVDITLTNYNKRTKKASIDISIDSSSNIRSKQRIQPGQQTLTLTIPLGDNIKTWDEFSPILHTLTATCDGQSKSQTFGTRQLRTDGKHLIINERRIFLRGSLECCVFPLTGTPPTDEVGWSKVFNTAKEWGLNHLRFHSWCPPEAAFRVADRMGFYLQMELPNWSLTIGKDTATTRFLYDEFHRIISQYGNHPSLCLISCGNELQPDFKLLNKMVEHMRQTDPRHLYTTSTFTFEKGHGKHPEPTYLFFVTQYTDDGWVRGQGIFEKKPPRFDEDYDDAIKNINIPIISHEIGQYAVYPNLQEINKYTGTLLPLNFIAVREDLRTKGLLHKANDYMRASGQFAAILYKEEIERALKTRDFTGYQLLSLTDFPGQGTALVGLLDAFWDSKGLATSRWFQQICSPVVPLLRYEKAIYTNKETFGADIDIANYGANDITNATIAYRISIEQPNKRFSKANKCFSFLTLPKQKD